MKVTATTERAYDCNEHAMRPIECALNSSRERVAVMQHVLVGAEMRTIDHWEELRFLR